MDNLVLNSLYKKFQNYPYGIPLRFYEQLKERKREEKLIVEIKKEVVFVVDFEFNSQNVNNANKTLLVNIIEKGFKKNINDFGIISYRDLLDFNCLSKINASLVITFGNLAFSIFSSEYEANINKEITYNKNKILNTFSISELNKDLSKKKEFWEVLKNYVN